MRYFHKFAIIGLPIGLIGILFGIIALLTPAWIQIQYNQSSEPITYGLFQHCQTHQNRSDGNARNETRVCEKMESRPISQYFQITGCVFLAIGFLTSVLCTAFADRRNIHFIPPIILFVGIICILVGLIFFIEQIGTNEMQIQFQVGYSMALMTMSCVVGILLLAYFSFTAGYISRHILSTVNIY